MGAMPLVDRQHERDKVSSPYFKDSFFIVLPCLIFMLALGEMYGGGTIQLGDGAEYPHIKKYPFESATDSKGHHRLDV